jgi:peptidoglycan/xylan/chitin deacetylase (PgdA/CDA1 family)
MDKKRNTYPARSTNGNSRPNEPARDNVRPMRAAVNPQAMNRKRSRKQLVIGVAVVVCAIIAISLFAYQQMSAPITVTVNGQSVSISGSHTVEHAVSQAGITYQAGDFVDVKGGVLREGGGKPFKLTVNGDESNDIDRTISNGDEVTIGDGDDVTEDTETDPNYTIKCKKVEKGTGPLSKVTSEGRDGVGTALIGKTSGKAVIKSVTQKPIDRVYTHYYPRVGSDKVICLTFDDGPYDGQTDKILDLLKKYDAKATFFAIGSQITDKGKELVKREADEGNLVCTHTWDHAAGSGNGVTLATMTKDEQRDEVTKGLAAIKDALGTDPSTVMRAPGGNFPFKVWKNVDDLISAEVNWTIDTRDWATPGADSIEAQIESAKAGDIVLMHDGGGDRSQTIQALQKALPYLKKKGYKFITVDQMLEYTSE